jgi:hypothetical protein
LLQQGVGCHDLAWDAESTLDCTMDDESFLQGVQLGLSIRIRTRQAFDRQDILSFCAFGRIITREHRFAVNQDGTASTFGLVASDLCTHQAQPVPEQIGKRLAGERIKYSLLTVNSKS